MGKADATRERILQAAMAEFSAYGVAGARVDRIAKTAGANKNLIYVYFESKEKLFTTVLEKNLLLVYEDLTFTPEDLPGFAARVFDFAMAHPELMRLVAWSCLEERAGTPAARGVVHDKKVEALRKAQHAGQVNAALPPGFLVVAMMTLATAWTAANPFGPVLAPGLATHPSALRHSIIEAVGLITSPQRTTP